MSYVPNTAMKHAHTDTPTPEAEPSAAQRALEAVEQVSPPMWTMIAAGVAGAVATALFLSLRSSTPANPPAGRRKGRGAKKKSD